MIKWLIFQASRFCLFFSIILWLVGILDFGSSRLHCLIHVDLMRPIVLFTSLLFDESTPWFDTKTHRFRWLHGLIVFSNSHLRGEESRPSLIAFDKLWLSKIDRHRISTISLDGSKRHRIYFIFCSWNKLSNSIKLPKIKIINPIFFKTLHFFSIIVKPATKSFASSLSPQHPRSPYLLHYFSIFQQHLCIFSEYTSQTRSVLLHSQNSYILSLMYLLIDFISFDLIFVTEYLFDEIFDIGVFDSYVWFYGFLVSF